MAESYAAVRANAAAASFSRVGKLKLPLFAFNSSRSAGYCVGDR